MPTDLGPLAGREFAAVLFDMDGTLIDSTPAVVRSWIRLAEEEGLDPARLNGFHGIPAMGIIQQVLPADRWDPAMARILALELADTDDIEPLPGAVDSLAALAADPDTRFAIATSCTRDLAAVRIAAGGIAPPPVVVTVDDVERGKPAPDPFLEAARRLGVDPADCLVVEDAPGGLAAAHAAGCATLAVTTTTPRAELHADAVVDFLTEVRFVPGVGIRVVAAEALGG